MSDFIQVIRSIDGESELPRQFAHVLRWISAKLPVKGAALIDVGQNAEKPSVLAADGGLAELLEAGSVRIDGNPTLAAGSLLTISLGNHGGPKRVVFHPVWIRDGLAVGGLLLEGEEVSENVSRHQDEFFLASTILHGLWEKMLLLEQLEREKAFISLLVEKKIRASGSAVHPGFDLITEGLDLPLYICDKAGIIVYASPAFLRLMGYGSMEELRQRTEFFIDTQSREAELNLLKIHGKVNSYCLGVRSSNGQRMEIQDTAVTVGAFIFGIFFDVTGFLAANKELKDALEIQELLNDRIIAAAQTLQRTQVTSIRALARLAEYRDQETGFHLQRICEYTRIIAQQVYDKNPYSFRLTSVYPNDISISSMLHDIGKVSIPDSILLKPGKLEGEEWAIMKQHTTLGWDILHRADKELGEQSFLTLASTIALSHHERFDGTGYPSGLVGERIPLSARISALADVYDALTTKRPYKEAWEHERAVEEIAGLSGAHFDPVLVDIFVSVAEEFDGIRRVFPG